MRRRFDRGKGEEVDAGRPKGGVGALEDGRMETANESDLRCAIRGLLDRASIDPISRCLAGQMEIILRSLEGWEDLAVLLEAGTG
jgi:hypothetical protein